MASAVVALAASPALADTAAMVAARSQAAIDGDQPPSWWDASLPDEVQRDVDRKGKQLAERLGLDDPSKTDAVAKLVSDHYGKVWAWHQGIDPELDAAWDAWDAARDNTGGKEKDELKALTVMTEQIDPIYAEFAPQIDNLIDGLNELVGEEKTIDLLDRVTRSPGAPRTYNAYVEMVPQMTDEEKAIIWDRMAQARRDSMAAWSDKRVVKIFKKYKVRNEFSLDYFGYGYQKHYRAWINRNK
ncbi:hypothetical protein Mal64_09100 [Pseudobythopirellula maris]|uniref:DUF3826 domain-containing protein n=1 Tax=Pseudobythopirellula maris TaxID=2527991 RepID=A0A5C5ZSN5_9BACT|nr:DUF3826 domain-containing protein [Pseudobythopirellula maris]TWT90519.1 hypothetical protein Mal64_09100 [Pseudobythopirellula maris]